MNVGRTEETGNEALMGEEEAIKQAVASHRRALGKLESWRYWVPLAEKRKRPLWRLVGSPSEEPGGYSRHTAELVSKEAKLERT